MKLRRLAFLGVVCLTFALPAGAQNLLPNPHFNGTLDPWAAFFAIYDGDHSATVDGTGSAAVSVPDTNGFGTEALVLQKCVSVLAGATYSFGGTVRIPSADVRSGHVRFHLEWHDTSDCSDGPASFANTPSLSFPGGASDTWVKLSNVAVAPPGAAGVVFQAGVSDDGPLPDAATKIVAQRTAPQAVVLDFAASIDDLFLEDVGPSGIPTLGAAGIALLIAGIAGAALLCLRR